MKKPLIVIAEPKDCGKTVLPIKLKKKIGGEIISGDSMQVYKHMDIGTAKIKADEMEGIPHHLIDILEPDEPFNVVIFQQKAREALEGIYSRGHLPIIVGGTGFYIQALLYDIDFENEGDDPSYRKQLETLIQTDGSEKLHRMLEAVDPASAQAIHPHNVKRIIRALEYYHIHNRPISSHNAEQSRRESPYHFLYFVLNSDRQILYDRIDRRVDSMMEEGLEMEVARLKAAGYTKDMVSMQGLGYKELFDYLDGACSLEEAVRIIKRDTRHFAKRQLTWFKRERDVRWIQKDAFEGEEAVLNELIRQIKKELAL